ncbi:MAG TPA: DUF3016 domain-containing protein [Lacunisphaera sp.]|jgi:hypothetical protein
MKTCRILSLATGLLAGTGFVSHGVAATKTNDPVTVVFQDPDNFTDAKESHTGFTSTSSLEDLRDYVQQTAAPLIPHGSKLTVTFIDVDFAGMIRPEKNNIRIMTGVTPPRAHVKFQLVDAAGKTTKEGERRLSDMNYQQTIRVQGRNDPLVYDKQLLQDWLEKEFPRTK